MCTVYLKRGETTERLIRRFIRKVKNEGIMEEYRKRKYYEKPSDRRRREKAKRKKVLAKLRKESRSK